MARITNFLKLWLPESNEVYNVEKDQNENFEKIDAKLKEWDTGKEPRITKKTGFNLDKTDLTENNSNKLFTAKGALDLFNKLTTAISTAVEAAKTALRLDIVKKIDKTAISSSLSSTSTATVLSSAGAKVLEDKKLNIEEAWKITFKVIGSRDTTTDLNTILTAGTYRSQYGGSTGNKWLNFPEDLLIGKGAFILQVLPMYGTDGSDKRCVRQIIYDYLTDRTATRISSADSTDNKIIFSDWHRIDGLDKEPIILKETGFNLPKTNIASNDSNKLFTAKGAFDMIVEFDTKLEKKLDVSVKDGFKGFTNGVNGLYLSQGNTLNFVSNNGTYHFNYFTIGDKPITEFQIRGGSSDSWGNLRLGNVYPTNISSLINNESRTDIANSYAVKTAYDRGSAALTEAAKKLPLTGGTVSGGLNVTGSLKENGNQVFHKGNILRKVWSGNFRATSNGQIICTLPEDWEVCFIQYSYAGNSNHISTTTIFKKYADTYNWYEYEEELSMRIENNVTLKQMTNDRSSDARIKGVYVI